MLRFLDFFSKVKGKARTRGYMYHLWFSYYLPWRHGIYSAKYRTELSPLRNYWNTYLYMKNKGYEELLGWLNLDTDTQYLKQRGPQYLGIDYLEIFERQQVQVMRETLKTSKWGLDIGIRYFPSKEDLIPYPLVDYKGLKELVFNYNRLLTIKQSNIDKFTLPQLIELILAGGPDNIMRGYHWIRRHQFFDYPEDLYIVSPQKAEIEGEGLIFDWFVIEEDLRVFWESDDRKRLEAMIFRLWKYDINVQRRLKRAYKWQALQYCRQVQQIRRLHKFNRFCFFFRFFIDYRLERYSKGYKEEAKSIK